MALLFIFSSVKVELGLKVSDGMCLSIVEIS